MVQLVNPDCVHVIVGAVPLAVEIASVPPMVALPLMLVLPVTDSFEEQEVEPMHVLPELTFSATVPASPYSE